MRLIVISDPSFIPEEAEIINSLFREGLECLHLRKPESGPDNFRSLLKKIQPEFLNRLSIHQHHELAEEFGIKKLHLTGHNRKFIAEAQLKALRAQAYTLSTSVHQLSEINNLQAFFIYTFFGPVFDSISKPGYQSNLPDPFFLKEEMKKTQVIALGGIDLFNIHTLKGMNFDGAAVLGTIWKNPKNAINTFSKLQQAL